METGNALSYILKYKNNRTGEEYTYNLLNRINDYYPPITKDEYKLYTDEQAQDRAHALIYSVKTLCSDFVINNDVVIINGCVEEVPVIGYTDTLIDFGNKTLIKI